MDRDVRLKNAGGGGGGHIRGSSGQAAGFPGFEERERATIKNRRAERPVPVPGPRAPGPRQGRKKAGTEASEWAAMDV